MFEFLLQVNPLIYLAAALLLMAFLVIVVLKPKKKNAKVEKVFPSKSKEEITEKDTTQTSETTDEIKGEAEPITVVDKTETEPTEVQPVAEQKEKKKIKIFKEKLKPTVEKVYVREKKETDEKETKVEPEIKSDISEEDLLSKMQFVKSSKKVSKLKALSEEELLARSQIDEQPLAEEIVAAEAEEEPQKTKHFDRSRRLSRCIECGSIDEMFCPHLSDKYLNINADRFLKSDEEMVNSLYNRTSQMLANSGVKTMKNFDDETEEDSAPLKMYKNDRDYMKDWLEKRKREEMAKFIIESPNSTAKSEDVDEIIDDIDLSAKTLLVVDSVMKRKSARKV